MRIHESKINAPVVDKEDAAVPRSAVRMKCRIPHGFWILVDVEHFRCGIADVAQADTPLMGFSFHPSVEAEVDPQSGAQ